MIRSVLDEEVMSESVKLSPFRIERLGKSHQREQSMNGECDSRDDVLHGIST